MQPNQSYELLQLQYCACYPSTAYYHTKAILFH